MNYLHLISFNCRFHEKTFYTLYTTQSPKFNKKSAIHSLKQGAVWGKNGKERQEKIVELAKKYQINDAFSIRVFKVSNEELNSKIKELNGKYGLERENYIKYSKV